MKKVTIFIGLAFLLVFCATPAYANGIPALPHAFCGNVTINGSPAPVGTSVEARGEGVATGIAGNPTITTVSGIYGTSNPFQPRLVVQGDIEEGATITFYVNGVSTGQATEWHTGETTELALSVTIARPSGDGVGPTTYYVETTLFGIEGRFLIDSEGKILKTIEATSADGNLTITIPKGTIALDKDGNPLSSLTADIDPSPPDPPEDANIIGLAYDFGPDGATFAPPMTLEWTVDPADIPAGLTIDDMVMAYYDETASPPGWVELPTSVVPGTNILQASVSHFTCFAIIGAPKPAAFALSSLVISPAEVGPGEKVNIGCSLANTGGLEGSYTVVLKINGVKEAEQSVTIAAGASKTVTFIVTKEEAGSYSVTADGMSGSFVVVTPVIAPPPPVIIAPPAPPPAPPAPLPPAPAPPAPPAPAPPNWPLFGGLIAAVVVAGLLIYFLVVRRRAY